MMIDNLATFTNVKGTDEIKSEFKNIVIDFYNLLINLQSFNRKKRLALIKLAHLFPQSLSTIDLRRVMEYSPNTSLSYIRNEIKELEKANLIVINRHFSSEDLTQDAINKKMPFQILINHKHPLMNLLIALSSFGTEYAKLTKSQIGENLNEP